MYMQPSKAASIVNYHSCGSEIHLNVLQKTDIDQSFQGLSSVLADCDIILQDTCVIIKR